VKDNNFLFTETSLGEAIILQDVKVHGRVEVWFHSFVTSTLVRVVSLTFQPLYSRRTYWITL